MRFAALICLVGSVAGCPGGTTTTTTGGTTGRHLGTTGSGGTTGGGPTCGINEQWFGDVCAAAHCGPGTDFEPCALGDGGFATCLGDLCQVAMFDSSGDCGSYGAECPLSTQCVGGVCQDAGLTVSGCASITCPPNTVCNAMTPSHVFCARQVCASQDDDRPCGTGRDLCCSDACVDLQGDSSNCGLCGRVCPAQSSCVAGLCRPQATCAGSQNNAGCALVDGGVGKCCGEICANVLADSDNCGGCDQSCPNGSTCADSLCISDAGFGSVPPCVVGQPGCPNPSCTSALQSDACVTDGGSAGTCCGGGCVDLASDNANCGACGETCGSGLTCARGVCAAAPSCTDASEGASCLLPGGQSGQCCAGQCGPHLDDDNCGVCGATCPAKTHCTLLPDQVVQCLASDGTPGDCQGDVNLCPTGTSCIDGTCYRSDCTALADTDDCTNDGLTIGQCCSQQCFSISSDDQHCGGCGRSCAATDTCTGGLCQGGSGIDFCGPATVCLTGFFCGGSACQAEDCSGFGNGAACAFGSFVGTADGGGAGVCCSGSCVDPTQDPANCGGCGITCPSGTACAASEGRPVCLATGTPNCGAAGCPAEQTCTQYGCVGSACSSSNAVCVARDGGLGACCGIACADLTADPLNCGTCGATCNTGQTCQSGVCATQTSACSQGAYGHYCNIASGPSYLCCAAGCIDTSADVENCGSCGNRCAAGKRCLASVCQ